MVEWKDISSRLIWVLVSAYGPGSKRNDDDRGNLWNGVDECVQIFGPSVSILLLSD